MAITNKLKIIVTLSVLLFIPLFAYIYLFAQQTRRYKKLEQAQKEMLTAYGDNLKLKTYRSEDLPDFKERVASITTFLPESTFLELRDIIVEKIKTERSYLPGHKKGGTVSYEALHHNAPKIIAFYHSPQLRALLSHIVGEQVVPTPIHDQSSCSLLYYDKPGDHIGWHYDHNFYNGRHFTVLIPIVNEHLATKALSSTKLFVKKNGAEEMIPTPPNTLVVFEGAKTLHKVTPLGPDEQRILLSMTFSTTPRASLHKEVARRCKDTAFFGVRALWS
ncbi:MAG: hypothetical protein KDJ65_04150 [Anaerolineae bacterium]|nr:hypothetical protein [Anaerolineae bacterium]